MSTSARAAQDSQRRPRPWLSRRRWHLRRARRRWRCAQGALAAAAGRARQPRSGNPCAAHGTAQCGGAGDRHRLQSVLRSVEHGPALAHRPRPPAHRRRGMARARARAHPAGAAVRGDSLGSLWKADAARIGRHPPSARVLRSVLPAPLPEHPADQRLHPVLRHRPGARAGRTLARDRHARGDAGRHRLCARQPHGAHQRRGRHLLSLQCVAPGAVLPADAGRAHAPRRPRGPRHRAAHPGSAPQRFLQPCLPRALSGPPARGRRRPARHRRPRLPQDAARPDAGRSDRALRGGRPRRPSGARFLELCRTGGPAAGRAPAARTSWPTLWARRSPRTGA